MDKEKDIWDIDYRDPKVDRNLTQRLSSKLRGSVRLSAGLFYTKEEWDEKSREVLERPLK